MARLDHVEPEEFLFTQKERAILKTVLQSLQLCIEEINVIRESLSLEPLDVPTRDDFTKRIKRNMRGG